MIKVQNIKKRNKSVRIVFINKTPWSIKYSLNSDLEQQNPEFTQNMSSQQIKTSLN